MWVLNFRRTLSYNLHFRKGWICKDFLFIELHFRWSSRKSDELNAVKTNIKVMCTTTTSLPYKLLSIENAIEQLDTGSLHFDFATGVFEASELDTVRLQNNTSISDLQMLPRYVAWVPNLIPSQARVISRT